MAKARLTQLGSSKFILLLILLVAAGLRLYGLVNLSPPGLEHDEVAHWLINQDILAGNHAVYFAEAYGHEAGFHYLQTVFMRLLGDNILALRLPSAFAGLILIAVNYALTRRLFNTKTALLSAALLAVLFWPVFYSRLALRAISLPVLSGLSAYFWWQAWQSKQYNPSKANESSISSLSLSALKTRRRFKGALSPLTAFSLAGFFAGLSLYTYMAARVVPIFYVLFTFYLLLFHRQILREKWRGIFLFFLIFLVTAIPLIFFLLTNPGIEYRISEINQPLTALMAGELKPALENGLKFLGMFGLSGDPLWRQNVAFLPVFGPIISLFFYIGVFICLWRWQKPRYLFLILWLFTAAIPSIVTIDAPSSIRIINALPILTIIPLIGLQVIHLFKPLSTVTDKLSPKTAENLTLIFLLLIFIMNGARTARAIFFTWPEDEEVQFVWQGALTDAAAYLDASNEKGPVAIGGWTPDTLDPPTMDLTLSRDDLSLRYFDPSQSLIFPDDDTGEKIRILMPEILPFDPYLENILNRQNPRFHAEENFNLYKIDSLLEFRPQFPDEITFGNEITFLGHDLSGAGDFTTYWLVQGEPTGNRSFFLHLVDENDQIVAQDDGLGAPAAHWHPGDILVQRHRLDMAATEESRTIRLGLYDPVTGKRLIASDGTEYTSLAPVGID